jgi:hypothetical protein
MSTYSTKIGADQIAFLVDGVLHDIADHVQADTGDVMVFDSRALQALRELPTDHDGSITEADEDHPLQIWFGGTGYEIDTES